MCLNIVYRGKKKRDGLMKLPEKIVCWKVCHRQGNQHNSKKYLSEYQHNGSYIPFLEGWNETMVKWSISYRYFLGFHSFLKKAIAYLNFLYGKIKGVRDYEYAQ